MQVTELYSAGCGERVYQPPPTSYPKMTSERLLESDVRPCGEHCFLNEMTEVNLYITTSLSTKPFRQPFDPWEANLTDTLREILSVIPDELPCRLARAVRKPCCEVTI